MMIGMCLVCQQILVSDYQHDFQQCDCEQKTMIDGGGGIGSRFGGVFLDLVRIIK